MKKSLALASLLAATLTALTACGGGDGGSGSGGFNFAPVSYINYGGLTWSSTTTQTFKGAGGFNAFADLSTMEPFAPGYCEQTACTGTDQYGRNTNCSPTNFNKSAGWRLPKPNELKDFYINNPSPTGWTVGLTWTNDLNLYDPTNGHIIITNNLRGYVTCVKPA